MLPGDLPTTRADALTAMNSETESDDRQPPPARGGPHIIRWAVCLWLLLVATLAAWIFLLPREPEPMGYAGTFYVFTIILSIFYWPVVLFVWVAWGVVRVLGYGEADIPSPPDTARGFEVIQRAEH